MWARRSHTFAPLTEITSNEVKFKWTKIEQDAYAEIKRILGQYALLTYPYLNEEFKIHNNANDLQLVSVIS